MAVLCETGGLLCQSPFILGYVHHFQRALFPYMFPLGFLLPSLFAYNLHFSVNSLDHCSPFMAATNIRRKLVVRKWIMWREMQNKALQQVGTVQLLQIQRKIHPFVKNITSYDNVQDFGAMSFRLSSRLAHY